MMKTHQAGELRAENVGQEVTLAGWIHRRRDHGSLIFLDVRDRSGLVQVVADPRISELAHAVASTLRGEYVVQVRGRVRARPEGLENLNMPTGQVEVEAAAIDVLNTARVPPFPIDTEGGDLSETMRLKYRYLDLRRARMQRNLLLRHRFVKFIRDYLDERGFVEIETPILFKSTPEGARDFLVPSRLSPGEFYALPQSPQQLKQLLMVAGFERYFQIARCFRDEDLRADRQLEFTQFDLEMSFVQREDVLALIEPLVKTFILKHTDKKLLFNPFPRLTYKEAMDRFGRDNPDLRFGMELTDITAQVKASNFVVFRDTIAAQGVVRGIRIPSAANYSRKQVDELNEFVKRFGAKGLATIAVEEGGAVRSSIAKFFTPDELQAILSRMQAEPGDLLAFVADRPAVVAESLGRLRGEMGRRLGLLDDDILAICWVIDFPQFTWNEEERRWDPSQHLFTLPLPEDIPLLDTDPGAARGSQYDLVCNGYEVAGGSIRIHQREIQEKIFPLIGLTMEQAQEQFGHMLEAFEYGAPPHGGIAMGVDRMTALLASEPGIREVIAFPKSTQGADLMAACPSPVEPRQLAELKIALVGSRE